jgi:hypothetical protein
VSAVVSTRADFVWSATYSPVIESSRMVLFEVDDSSCTSSCSPSTTCDESCRKFGE